MIDEALIKITINTDDDSVDVGIVNFPDLPECTHDEFVQNYPAISLAQKIILAINQSLKINRALKTVTETMEKKENENV